MVYLSAVAIIFSWVIIGVWISYKRNWYNDWANDGSEGTRSFLILVNIIFMPFALINSFYEEYLKKEWDNK